MVTSVSKKVFYVENGFMDRSEMMIFFLNGHKEDAIITVKDDEFFEYYTYDLLIKNTVKKIVSIPLDKNVFRKALKILRYSQDADVVAVCDEQGNIFDLLGEDGVTYGTQYFDYGSDRFNFLKKYDIIISRNVTAESFEFVQRILLENDMPQIVICGAEWGAYQEALEDKERVLWNTDDSINVVGKTVFDVSEVFKYFAPRMLCIVKDGEEEYEKLACEAADLEEAVQIVCCNDTGMKKVLESDYDVIIDCTGNLGMLDRQLVCGYGISPFIIKKKQYLLKAKMIQKYNTSNDKEIQEILAYWKENELSVYNKYCQIDEEIEHEVIWDWDANMPYIMFEEKKMYFPRNCSNIYRKGNKLYMEDIMGEQRKDSPHLYLSEEVFIKEGDVIVDAGVCEGNFALRFADIASKIYLIECEPEWMEALELTFKEYKDKVVFCNKFLSNVDGENTITLDTLVKDSKVDFVKMDIEGAETDALAGAENTFKNNNIKCAICGYHRKNDAENIVDLLQSYGYRTSYTDGYMVFEHDPNIYEHADFRRGIVHGYKGE